MSVAKKWKARILVGGKGAGVEVTIQAKNFPEAKKLILAQHPAHTRFVSGPTETR